MRYTARRDFLKGLAAAVPASEILSVYQATAAPLRKKVKIADVKAMAVRGSTDWNLVKNESDSGIVGALASAHCAAAIRDFRAQEFSPGTLTTDEWEKFVVYDGPVIKDGKYRVSDKPGLGVELNEDCVRAHLMPGETWWG
jgi:L-alanine-DL-glutamate epimerase-like enolase superfamily enzyme